MSKAGLQSSLNDFIESQPFKLTGMSLVFLTCILLALYDPFASNPNAIDFAVILNLCIDAFFVFEFVIVLIALGIQKYFLDSLRILDAFVSMGSLFEIILFIVQYAQANNTRSSASGIVQVVRTLRVLRLVRLVKVIQFLPRLTFDGSVLPQTYDLFLIFVFPATSLVGFALLSFVIIGTAIQYRCVPYDLESPNVINNVYYQDYGINYFFSQYNVMFCGYRYMINIH